MCDTPAAPFFPARYPVPEPPVVPKPSLPLRQWPRIAPALYPVIGERARYESLHDLAQECGVSHETIRAILRRPPIRRSRRPTTDRPG